jgi:hypothetical protein
LIIDSVNKKFLKNILDDESENLNSDTLEDPEKIFDIAKTKLAKTDKKEAI